MYINADELKQYALDRNIKLSESDNEINAIIVRACDYINLFQFIGVKSESSQQAEWPRKYKFQGEELEGTPYAIKKATLETCLAINSGFEILPNINSESFVKSEKVGELEIHYDNEFLKSKGGMPTLSAVEMLLKPYIKSVSESFSLKTIRY